MKECPGCGATRKSDSETFCTQCGARLQLAKLSRQCPTCYSAYVDATAKYCPKYGAVLVPYPILEENGKTLTDIPAVDPEGDTKKR